VRRNVQFVKKKKWLSRFFKILLFDNFVGINFLSQNSRQTFLAFGKILAYYVQTLRIVILKITKTKYF